MPFFLLIHFQFLTRHGEPESLSLSGLKLAAFGPKNIADVSEWTRCCSYPICRHRVSLGESRTTPLHARCILRLGRTPQVSVQEASFRAYPSSL